MSDKPLTLADAIGVCLALGQQCLAEVRALARQPGPPGPQGPPGRNAADLELFKNYIDQCVAVRLGAAKATSPDGGRTLRWQFGSNVVEVKTAIVLDAGVWKDGTAYSQGDGVTWAGSFWIAQGDTSAKPGGESDDWRLAVKRGRDGKDGKSEPGPAGPRGERGEQGQRGFAV
jgi:integrin beta 3